jgi:hypothetical protein
VIPDLAAIAERFAVCPALAPLILEAFLIALALSIQSVARWFEDRNS